VVQETVKSKKEGEWKERWASINALKLLSKTKP
jgi:hypothetical protein